MQGGARDKGEHRGDKHVRSMCKKKRGTQENTRSGTWVGARRARGAGTQGKRDSPELKLWSLLMKG